MVDEYLGVVHSKCGPHHNTGTTGLLGGKKCVVNSGGGGSIALHTSEITPLHRVLGASTTTSIIAFLMF
jgi:hypothetical protein